MTDSMRHFAGAHAARLRKALARQIRRSAKHADEKTIHDLRVSIRRLSQCLVEFHQFFPRRRAKKTLKRLGSLMRLAARMRNRDIAIELIGDANPNLTADLNRERDRAKRKLTRSLETWRNRDLR